MLLPLSTLYEMSKQIILVIGTTGPIGSATVQALSAKYVDKFNISENTAKCDCGVSDIMELYI